jgi:hypothetical protein
MAVNFKTDIGDCCITGCTKKGRILGYLGGIKLIYCPIHRKYGQEVINMFLEDIFNFRKSQLTELAKQELLFNGDKILDEENEKRLGSWFRKEIYQTYLKTSQKMISQSETILINPMKQIAILEKENKSLKSELNDLNIKLNLYIEQCNLINEQRHLLITNLEKYSELFNTLKHIIKAIENESKFKKVKRSTI